MGHRVSGRLGELLAQQLVVAGEHVVDVPPTPSARVRLLGSTKVSKNEPERRVGHGHRRVASLRAAGRAVGRAVIRLRIDRYDDPTALRTQAACRLHVTLRELVPGGAPRRLSAESSRQALAQRASR